MISDNEPIITKYISVPKDYHSLACGAFLAGIVEAVLDGAQLVIISIFFLIKIKI